MDLYPQANTQRPSVIYVPMRGIGQPKGAADAPKSTPGDGK
jgi:hypothetical protein